MNLNWVSVYYSQNPRNTLAKGMRFCFFLNNLFTCLKEIEQCKPFTSVKLRTKQRLKRLLVPPVGEAEDHSYFLTALGEHVAGLDLAFPRGNLAAPQILQTHAFWLSNITSRTFPKKTTKNLHNCTEICTRSYFAALFLIVRNWKQPNAHCWGISYTNYWYICK